MSSALITVTTKPADTSWFTVAVRDTARRVGQWAKSQPGYVASSTQRVAPNTVQTIIMFDTRANLDLFMIALDANPDHQAREAYKTAHGQVSTTSVL